MPAETWSWPGSTIRRVVDGDTIDALVHRDLGFHGTASFIQRLRLNRVNAPAAHTTPGRAATAALTAMLSASELLVQTVAPYKYGDEWMAEVTLPDGTNVSDELVKRGLAVYWDGTGARPSDG